MTAGEAAVAIAVLGLPFAIVFGAGVAVGYWWRGYRRRTTGATPRQRDSSTNEALGVRFGGLVVRPSGLPGGGRNWFGAGVSLTPDHLQACGVDGIAVRLFPAGGAVRIAGAGAPEECDDRVRDSGLERTRPTRSRSPRSAFSTCRSPSRNGSSRDAGRGAGLHWPGFRTERSATPKAAAAVLEAIADWRIIIGRDGDGDEGLDVDVEDEGPDVVAAGEEHDAACGACGEAVSPAERHADHRLPIVVFEQQRREHAEHAAGPAGLSIH